MRAAFVSPVQYLNDVQSFSDYHLCLTHLVILNRRYREFYKNRSKLNDYIILDNGAVEKSGRSVPMRDIVTAAILIHPTVVVLPDFLFDGKKTLTELKTALRSPALRLLRSNKSTAHIKIAAVIQGVDQAEWLESFKVLNEHNEIDLLCVPKVTGQTFGARWQALELIKGTVSKKVHLLGSWWQGTLDDVKRESSYPFVQGIDTPKPIRLAAQGKDLSQWNTLEHDRDFLGRNNGPIDIDLLRRNCEGFKEICKG